MSEQSTSSFKALDWQRYLIRVGAFLVALVFVAIHLDASPSQAQLTHLVWLLPLLHLLPAQRPLFSSEKTLLLLSCGLFFGALISFAVSGDLWVETGFRSYWQYLLPLGLLAVFARIQLDRRWLAAIAMAAMLMTLVVVLKDLRAGDVRGIHHGLPIPFGIVSLTTGLICYLMVLDSRFHWAVRVLLLLAALMGFVATVWSQTRGVWVYWLLWLLVAALAWWWLDRRTWRKTLVLSVTAALIVILGLSNSATVTARVGETMNSLNEYFVEDNAQTSLGQRFELWKVAWQTFTDSPLLGQGKAGFMATKEAMHALGETSASLWLQHAHNDVLWVLSTRGLLSLVFYVALYAFLISFFARHCSHPDTRLAAYAGLTVSFGGLVYGLSEIFLSLKITIGYFMIVQTVLVSYVSQCAAKRSLNTAAGAASPVE
ncbi:hypothetical protein CHH28_05550 [Bacterioplanes sanyensis]|uniref:O-antigen ligase-related domain-containing protein n=1 Tax=Bacterioplanes sanyensis TaxID=1249553 RepID=A0A222FHR0_9GAMM|nr:O-antigen ligase family protein [Bacterioplanes sanyensis]ASP38182.1 hypothetical protein CHH28_05550 [Bacterioplanes sanyensis]